MEAKDARKPADLSRAKFVGFWKRFAAFLVDSIILCVVIVPLLFLAYGSSYFTTYIDALIDAASGLPSSRAPFMGPADVFLSLVLPALAFILFWRYRAATPGKMMVRARIVDARTGGEPSTGQLIGRFFAYFVSLLPFGLGFLWIAFDKRKRGWHDRLAGTVVIREED